MIRRTAKNPGVRASLVLITFMAAALMLAVPSAPATAAVVAGVNVPDALGTEPTGKQLLLNGAGVRKKLFIKIYVGALYLSARQSKVEAVLAAPGPKSVTMHFLYKKLKKSKLTEGWDEGFQNNHSAGELAGLKNRIAQFNALFADVKKGDTISIDYVPGKGTSVSLNGRSMGEPVRGEDFFRALLKIWLGTEPADKNLKQAMLGKG